MSTLFSQLFKFSIFLENEELFFIFIALSNCSIFLYRCRKCQLALHMSHLFPYIPGFYFCPDLPSLQLQSPDQSEQCHYLYFLTKFFIPVLNYTIFYELIVNFPKSCRFFFFCYKLRRKTHTLACGIKAAFSLLLPSLLCVLSYLSC